MNLISSGLHCLLWMSSINMYTYAHKQWVLGIPLESDQGQKRASAGAEKGPRKLQLLPFHDVIMMVFDPWLTPPSVFKWLFRQNVKMETGLTGWCQLVIVFAPLKGNSCWCYFVSGPTQPTVRGHKHDVTKELFLVMIQWMNHPAPSSLLPASTLDSCQIMEIVLFCCISHYGSLFCSLNTELTRMDCGAWKAVSRNESVHSKVVSTQKLPLKWPIKPFYSTWFNVEMFYASFSPFDTKYAKILLPY